MMKIPFYFFSGFFLCNACSSPIENSSSTIEVDIESGINNFKQVNLSEHTCDVKYVPLESSETLPQISRIEFSDSLILVTDAKLLLLYNEQGHLIRKIGKQGRGPGEYIFIINLGFGQGSNIYCSFMYDLLEYNLEGSLIGQTEEVFLINQKHFLRTWYAIDDSLFLGRIPNTTGQEVYKAGLVDKTGGILKLYRNYDLFNRESALASGTDGYANVILFNGNYYYKEYYNDTLFYLNNNYDLVPKYNLKLGRYKEPISEREKIPPGDPWRYIYIVDVFLTNNFLLIRSQFGHHFPARRFTPVVPPLPVQGLKPTWYNTTEVVGLYNKTTGELFFIEPTSSDNQLFTTGFYNDIDGGPRFIPRRQINDSTMVMWIEAKHFKDHILSEDFKNSTPKYPDKKIQLEKMASEISEFDNPILMFVTFNK